MKILISDQHAGTQMWQAAILEELGHHVDIYSYSSHKHLLPNKYKNKFNTDLTTDIIQQYDTILVSFPPAFISNFINIKTKFPKILNCGHRLQIHTDNTFLTKCKELIDKGEIILCSMSNYDTEYIKHYLGISPIELYVTCCHIPKHITYNPIRSEIIISPVHAHNLYPFKDIYHMNFSAKEMGFNITFSFVNSLYGEYKYEDLCNHQACILFPYSAFSISMVEMYELNIPMFVPSKNILLDKNSTLMNDTKLYPCYHSEQKMKEFDIPHVNSPHLLSPNSYEEKDSDYWFNYTYFYTRENVILWDNPKDLFEKLISTNFKNVSDKMKNENKKYREIQLNNWKTLLQKL